MNLTEKQKEYLPYYVMLDLMLESGKMNMYGAPAKLRELHPELDKRKSIDVVAGWMQSKTGGDNE
tara:strand:- start:680 stop:874 length:195 start_codon:yes stop_codon:yes gene_type:complete